MNDIQTEVATAIIGSSMDHSTMIDIDRRKYPDWLRHGPERPKPIAILEVPERMSVEKLSRIKEEFGGKGYHILLRSKGEHNVTMGRTTHRH